MFDYKKLDEYKQAIEDGFTYHQYILKNGSPVDCKIYKNQAWYMFVTNDIGRNKGVYLKTDIWERFKNKIANILEEK